MRPAIQERTWANRKLHEQRMKFANQRDRSTVCHSLSSGTALARMDPASEIFGQWSRCGRGNRHASEGVLRNVDASPVV